MNCCMENILAALGKACPITSHSSKSSIPGRVKVNLGSFRSGQPNFSFSPSGRYTVNGCVFGESEAKNLWTLENQSNRECN